MPDLRGRVFSATVAIAFERRTYLDTPVSTPTGPTSIGTVAIAFERRTYSDIAGVVAPDC